MATEKQAAYIQSLIDGLRVENMEWVAKLSGMRQSHREFKIQTWLDNALGTRDYENEVALDDTMNAYNARLDEIAASIEAMSTGEASRAIDSLKNCKIVW